MTQDTHEGTVTIPIKDYMSLKDHSSYPFKIQFVDDGYISNYSKHIFVESKEKLDEYVDYILKTEINELIKIVGKKQEEIYQLELKLQKRTFLGIKY
jgi:hypothetical protein